jgi:hypothetical protein
MKITLLIMAILIGMTAASAQVKALKINHPNSERTIVIKENKRVIVRTKTGEKVKGRLMFVNDEAISLKGQEILLADIVKIQHNPLLLAIIVDGLLFYTAGGIMGVGILISAFGGTAGSALYFIIPAAAVVYGGKASPKFTKGYKTYKGWSYEVVTISDGDNMKK